MELRHLLSPASAVHWQCLHAKYSINPSGSIRKFLGGDRHTKVCKFSRDLYLAAQSSATIVILMGMKKLNEIIEVFNDLNKNNTPVAIVQNGSRPDEKLGLGTVSTISEIVKAKGLSSPAIIVIGEIVRYTQKGPFQNL